MLIKFSSIKNQRYKYKHKNRSSTIFKPYKLPLTSFRKIQLIAFRTVNLFLFHIKTAINYISKILSLRAKLSRKMRFRKKKLTESFQKTDLMFSNANKIFTYTNQQNFKIKSYFLIKKKVKKYLLINLPKIPLSKKPLNMRMGKGKGGVKSWIIKINAGTPFITLKSTKFRRNIFILNSLFKLLPISFTNNHYPILFHPGYKYTFTSWRY